MACEFGCAVMMHELCCLLSTVFVLFCLLPVYFKMHAISLHNYASCYRGQFKIIMHTFRHVEFLARVTTVANLPVEPKGIFRWCF